MASPMRSFRLDDSTWARWQKGAEEMGVTLSRLIVDSVEGVLGNAPKIPAFPNTLLQDLPEEEVERWIKPRATAPPDEMDVVKVRRVMKCQHSISPDAYCKTCDP